MKDIVCVKKLYILASFPVYTIASFPVPIIRALCTGVVGPGTNNINKTWHVMQYDKIIWMIYYGDGMTVCGMSVLPSQSFDLAFHELRNNEKSTAFP